MVTSEWSQAVFEQAGRRFVSHYQSYLARHSGDWLALSSEHQNLLALATQLWKIGDYQNLLSIREDLQHYFDWRGYWEESIKLNEWAMAAAQSFGDSLSVARFMHDRGNILHQSGDYLQAERMYRESEGAYRLLDNPEMALNSRHMRSMVVRAQGQLSEADFLCRTTIDEAKALGLGTWLAHPLYVRGLIARDLGHYQEARDCVEQSLVRLSQPQDKVVIAQCYHFLGELALIMGKFDEANLHIERSLQLSRDAGILRRVAATTRLRGDLAREQGNYQESAYCYEEALQVSAQIGDRPEIAKVILSKAKLCMALWDTQNALILLEQVNYLYTEIGDPRGNALIQYSLFGLYLKKGDLIAAFKHLANGIRCSWKAGLFKPGYLLSIIRRRIRHIHLR